MYNDGILYLINSTIYRNNAGIAGGGIYDDASLNATNDTISDNGVQSNGSGGGIAVDAAAAATLNNTIVATNFRSIAPNSQSADDIAGAVTGSNNLVGPGGAGGLTDGVNGNLVGVLDPGLAPLFGNGGPTQTLALKSASPAFDAGSTALAVDAQEQPLATDQRGKPRVAGNAVDIGAYEAQPPSGPSQVAAVAGADQVMITWAVADDAATYNVYRGTSPGGEPSTPLVTGLTARGFLDTTVTAGVSYYYKVTAVNAAGESAGGDEPAAEPFLPVISGTAANDSIRLFPDGDQIHIDWTMGTVGGQVLINDPNGLTINGNGGSDTIVVVYNDGCDLPDRINFNGTFTISGRGVFLPQAGQTWNLNRSTIYLQYSNPAYDPLASVQAALRAGYSNGSWNGSPTATTGVITSSAATANLSHTTGIGYADSADGQGVNTTPNTIELTYTLYGDANLDHQVNSADLQILLFNLNRPGSWDQGDFNYDVQVNSADLQNLLFTLNTSLSQATPLATAATPAAKTATSSTNPGSDPSPGLVPGISATGSATTPTHHSHPAKVAARKRR